MEKKYCKLNGTGKIYEVIEIHDKQVKLVCDNVYITTELSNISFVPYEQIQKRSSNYTITTNSSTIPSEIMLRHKFKNEAIAELDKYLDQALVAKLGRVRIIHGKHGGVLRKAVHEYLASHPYVKEFSIADYSEGGIGVTIAILGKKN